MRLMGLEAIYPKPRLSQPGDDNNRKYPYLLRGLNIERANQVWAADITYVRLRRGFVYLTAIMDWYSRYVLSWALSTTLDVCFCLEVLREALARSRPEIFNTDQGCQFTSGAFTDILEGAGVSISMNAKGRVFDNIFVERLWRTVKYEEIYLKDYEDVDDARCGIGDYFRFYNNQRLHQALSYRTPAEGYFGGEEKVSLNTPGSIPGNLKLVCV
jgi:putative transposase